MNLPKSFNNARIFITGGAGYLGRGILKRAYDENWPCSFTIFSRDEVKHSQLKRLYPHVNTVRGDVGGELELLTACMMGHDIVIHAAATKVIPVAEYNPIQTFQDNIIGSWNVAYAACKAGIKQVIGISTDKVCHPVNVYGVSKKCLEYIFLEANTWRYETDFHLVRYGNVLDSTASVLTLWYKQIQDEGELRITNPDMTRFWLSVDQAVNLILLTLQQIPGTIIIPLLPGLKMEDMANYVYPDADWNIIGERPGEKQHEELVTIEEVPFAEYLPGSETVRLWPSISEPLNESKRIDGPYTSNNPVSWLTKEELFEMAEINDYE